MGVITALGLTSAASAETVIFDLDTGNLSSGSGVAFDGGSVIGLYPAGATIPVEVTFDSPTSATLDFDLSGVGVPNATEFLSGIRFEFTILDLQRFSLSLETSTGEINGALTDPQVPILIEKFLPGAVNPVASTTAMMDLSTGTVDVAGGCAGPARVGLPLEEATRDVTLVGVACAAELGSGSNMILDLKLKGVLPEASATPLCATALLSLAALVRARRASDEGNR